MILDYQPVLLTGLKFDSYFITQSIIATVIGILSAWDYVIKRQEATNKKKVKPIGILIILLAIALVVMNIHQHSVDEAAKNQSDSTSKARYLIMTNLQSRLDSSQNRLSDTIRSYNYNVVNILAKYGLKIDSTRNQIVKNNIPNEPHFIAPETMEGVEKKIVGDTIYTSITIENSGLEAENMNGTIYILLKKEGDSKWYKRMVIFDRFYHVNIGKTLFTDDKPFPIESGPFKDGYDEYYLIEGQSANKKINFSLSYVYHYKASMRANGQLSHFSIYGGEMPLREALNQAIWLKR